ncbi:MAG: 1,2-phenylacetyl-CoA epoxidase subunit PaaD [Syntrophothermus sp.]
MVNEKNDVQAEIKNVTDMLSEISDPEIPAVNIVELGIVRGVAINNGRIEVSITPTYSGCPAMQMIKDNIRSRLESSGYSGIEIVTVYSPAWTTDWMSDETKEKLKNYGIAPPGKSCMAAAYISDAVSCPFCGSEKTEIKSRFGSTACKAFYYCKNCLQMFEHFKRI